MGAFWAVAAALAALAAGCVLVPLWSSRPRVGPSRERANTRIFRERLADLDLELEERRIDAAQYRALRAELERTLLDDVPRASARRRRGGGARLAATVAAVAAPLLALSYYYVSSYRGAAGEWMALQARLETLVRDAAREPGGLPPEALAELPAFTRVLQSRVLREGMDDPDDLLLLGSSFVQLRMPGPALAVLDRALQLAPHRADVMLGYAQASLLANDGRLDQVGERLLHTALQTDPGNRAALMMLGFGAFNAGDYDAALQAWRTLLDTLEPDAETARAIRDAIARAERARDAPTIDRIIE